ncbi:hypothetical protein Pelo_10463 [Pelomyxa schiedti]|nr:hypothetical protein Pelo_10463 [Pelomyxa schiedti]
MGCGGSDTSTFTEGEGHDVYDAGELLITEGEGAHVDYDWVLARVISESAQEAETRNTYSPLLYSMCEDESEEKGTVMERFQKQLPTSVPNSRLLKLVNDPAFDPNAKIGKEPVFIRALSHQRSTVAEAIASKPSFSPMTNFEAMCAYGLLSKPWVHLIMKHGGFRCGFRTSQGQKPFDLVLQFCSRDLAFAMIGKPDFDASRDVTFGTVFAEVVNNIDGDPELSRIALKVASHPLFNPHDGVDLNTSLTLFEWAVSHYWWEGACVMLKHPRFNIRARSYCGSFAGRDFAYIVAYYTRTAAEYMQCRVRVALTLLCGATLPRCGYGSVARNLSQNNVKCIVKLVWPLLPKM